MTQPMGRSPTQGDASLPLNVIKTKEMIVDYKKKREEHAPILNDGL